MATKLTDGICPECGRDYRFPADEVPESCESDDCPGAYDPTQDQELINMIKQDYNQLYADLEYKLECALADLSVDGDALSGLIHDLDDLLCDMAASVLAAAGIEEED